MDSAAGFAQVLGLSAGGALLAPLAWSIARPDRRLWPPPRYATAMALVVWALTLAVFGSAFWLGVSGWGTLGIASAWRWGVGLPLVLIGNLAVWYEVARFGFTTTSGGKDRLYTDGLYRVSRHPQYVADMLILIGWALFSASAAVMPVTVIGLLALVMAPFAEEPWLEAQYGDAYRRYRQRVRRFF